MLRVFALLGALIACAACSEPPQKEMDRAQGAIDAARAAGAEHYATSEFSAATAALGQAHAAVAERDYRLALSRALDASDRAQEAARQAASGKARARSEAETALNTTTVGVQQLRTALKAAEDARVPAQQLSEPRSALARFELVLQEARTLLEKEQYLEAKALLEDVPQQINEEIVAVNEAQAARPPRRRR